MNSDKIKEKRLPHGWILCSSKSNPGRKYYFNKKTGKSSWTEPQAEADDKSGQSKQKVKKSKSLHIDKSKKEELNKNNLKRKSDGPGQSCPQKKKQKDVTDTSTPEKQNTQSSKQTPTKHAEAPKKDSPHCGTKSQSSKNIANARLSHLRQQLEADTKKEESSAEKSPSKPPKEKRSPPTTQTEPPTKVQRTEIKSPNLTESKCSTTTQSPSSDSLQSIPSPSQFLAANKIISSMKAQLPEEFSDKLRHKNTFADIEEGICNQTPEYPFMKHPATPPQFSEASKLVSAIKSKLSYKGLVNKEVSSYTPAQNRMDSLRKRLSNEPSTDTKSFLCSSDYGIVKSLNAKGPTQNSFSNVSATHGSQCVNRNIDSSEAMDVDVSRQVIQKAPLVQCTKDTIGTVDSKENLVLVVDTNIFIHELDVIKDVLNSHIKGYSNQPNLLVPWRVINELDRLKDNNNGNGAICKRAKAAMDYLYKSLPENTRIKGQSLRDANSHIYPCELPDDEILNCCLQQSERGNAVILVSNDKNLCNKAVINGVKSISLADLRPLLGNKSGKGGTGLQRYVDAMYQLLATILENEMRAKYGALWERVVYKPPPWALADVVACVLRHWRAVFHEVFPRIEHLIADLATSYEHINDRNPNSLAQSEVFNFKELCLDVAKKCQIIPEYMELAKLTVERLQREGASESPQPQPKCERDGEMPVIHAFEGLWTVFSSYCAKLASGLGVPHNLEDKLQCNDPLNVLTSKYHLFYNQIQELTNAITGALSNGTEAGSELSRLEASCRASLALVCADAPPLSREQLMAFTNSCRNMLQEAGTKFSQLTEILAACKHRISND